jgi:hypothetical protein
MKFLILAIQMQLAAIIVLIGALHDMVYVDAESAIPFVVGCAAALVLYAVMPFLPHPDDY